MLAAFAPQILLYGLAVVMYGILQAHRKFTAPALAPILSSLVVIGAYVLFVPLGRSYTTSVTGLPLSAELTLSLGTTLGVAALAATALPPVWRLRLRWRPTLRFPEGIARRATSLAAVGVAALVAQDASVLVVTRLANARGGSGGAAVTVYQYSWQVFVSVYAVLAIPVAISAFPVLAARKGAAFDEAAASSTRATALASWLGAALLAAAALPVARAFPYLQHSVAGQFAVALAAFAPGLAGYGLTACLSRVLLADGRNRITAIIMVAGWLVVIAVDVIAVPLVRADWVVPVLGLANTIGMTASGAALLVAVGRARGAAALHGAWRAIGAGLAGAVAGAAAGLGVTALLPVSGHWLNAAMAVLAGTCALVAFCAVVAVLDGGDLRSAASRIRRRIRAS
jgi:putative peptidoglycan lipid II flippase